MLLYNVTIGIDKEIEKEWLAWIKMHYLPTIAATGFFSDSKVYRIITHDDENSVSYSIQFFADRIENVVQYLDQHTGTIIETHRQKFKDRHVVFNTLLEEV
jgi:S-adenosylmethionine:tRNA-ribosyltransferase-isomerase (queuine synthetase)